MLDAFRVFQEAGGRFIYLGGNGFYWRTSYHPTLPGAIEMRCGEDGLRSWMAEGGEYYHSFTGEQPLAASGFSREALPVRWE